MNRLKPRLLSLIVLHMALKQVIDRFSILLISMSPWKCKRRTKELELAIATFPGTLSAALFD